MYNEILLILKKNEIYILYICIMEYYTALKKNEILQQHGWT